jgi:siroheme synthase
MKGKVIITGAGPGDPGLLTVKAFQILQIADVVLSDRLVSLEIFRITYRQKQRTCM